MVSMRLNLHKQRILSAILQRPVSLAYTRADAQLLAIRAQRSFTTDDPLLNHPAPQCNDHDTHDVALQDAPEPQTPSNPLVKSLNNNNNALAVLDYPSLSEHDGKVRRASGDGRVKLGRPDQDPVPSCGFRKRTGELTRTASKATKDVDNESGSEEHGFGTTESTTSQGQLAQTETGAQATTGPGAESTGTTGSYTKLVSQNDSVVDTLNQSPIPSRDLHDERHQIMNKRISKLIRKVASRRIREIYSDDNWRKIGMYRVLRLKMQLQINLAIFRLLSLLLTHATAHGANHAVHLSTQSAHQLSVPNNVGSLKQKTNSMCREFVALFGNYDSAALAIKRVSRKTDVASLILENPQMSIDAMTRELSVADLSLMLSCADIPVNTVPLKPRDPVKGRKLVIRALLPRTQIGSRPISAGLPQWRRLINWHQRGKLIRMLVSHAMSVQDEFVHLTTLRRIRQMFNRGAWICLKHTPLKRNRVLKVIDKVVIKVRARRRFETVPQRSHRTHTVMLNAPTILSIIQTLRRVRECGLPDMYNTWESETETPTPFSIVKIKTVPSYPSSHKTISKRLKREYVRRFKDVEYRKLTQTRSKLPVMQAKTQERILKRIRQKDVVVLVSETGSGKSTQLPQLILDVEIANLRGAACNVLCTQPRRIAATSVAARVALEQRTDIGDGVGFNVRFHNHMPRRYGSISYFTTGILFRALCRNPSEVLDHYSHLIIDEVHERDLTTDMTLALLRDLIRARKAAKERCPKLILMSATIDALSFETYFAKPQPGATLTVATIEVAGRNYGTEVHMLEDFLPDLHNYHDGPARELTRANLSFLKAEDAFAQLCEDKRAGTTIRRANKRKTRLAQHAKREEAMAKRPVYQDVPLPLTVMTIAHVLRSSNHGDVLVFLPGLFEINKVQEMLRSRRIADVEFGNTDLYRIFRIHGSLYETNSQAFEPVPHGCRRIILSTNIGQTSITFPNVVHVIDSGRQRFLNFDQTTGLSRFYLDWVDQASAQQRKGRAGRTQPGHYWALFTQDRLAAMRSRPIPEIQRVDLAPACLQTKAHGTKLSLDEFFAGTLDPPNPQAVAAAILELKKLGLLDDAEQTTPLGLFASYLPLHPAMSRGVLLGALFHCFQPMLIFAAHNPDKPLVQSSESLSTQVMSNIAFAGVADDDRFAFVEAFQRYDEALREGDQATLTQLVTQRCVKHESYLDMLNVGRQVYDYAADYGIVPRSEGDRSNAFRQIPEVLNENSHRVALVKSIASTTMHTKLAVWHEAGQTWWSREASATMRPASVNDRRVQANAGRVRTSRQDGELLAYRELVELPSQGRASLVETSSITPLMAMLFAAPIRHVDEDVIEVDGWLRYEVRIDDALPYEIQSPAALIVELRKAIDRFVVLACSNLRDSYENPLCDSYHHDHHDQHDHQRAGSQSPFSQVFSTTTPQPLRDALAAGLAEILEQDAHHWDEMIYLQKATQEKNVQRILEKRAKSEAGARIARMKQ